MKLKLEAALAVEGTGIIRSGEILRLLRPPYLLHESPVLPEESIADAISRCGFVPSSEQFATWEEAICFLNKEVMERRRALNRELPDLISGSELVGVAPEDVLTKFLDRVEQELIPKGNFEHAENLLLAIVSSDAVTRYPSLVTRAAKLLLANQTLHKTTEAAICGLANRDLRFTSLEKHGELKKSVKLAEDIRKRGFFAPVA